MSTEQPYIVSARKYRPSTFASVVGQTALTSTLKKAIEAKRLAHAYLFCGPRGVGKTSCARIFAKTINCEHPTPDGEACGQCDSCRAIDQGNSFNIIELDAASNNGVDQMRTLTEQVNVRPQSGTYRVFIIDEVHMLSTAAFNAFLKTLEEPPSYAIFILATTEKHKVIPTILSRCQIYDFKRITTADIAGHLQSVADSEGIPAEAAALSLIARKADGAMRDALSIFDQVAASAGGNITYKAAVDNLNVLDSDFYFRLVDAFRAADVASALLLYKEVRDRGFDSLFFLNGLAAHVRDLLVAADPRTLPLLEASGEEAERYRSQASSMTARWYYEALGVLNNADFQYRTAANKQLLVEYSLIRLCRLAEPTAVPTPQAPKAAPAPARQEPSPRPVPQAAPAPAPRPAAPRTTGYSRPAIPSIKRPAQAPSQPPQAKESAPAPAAEEPPAAPYGKPDEKQIRELWIEFAGNHPELRILSQTMRSCAPEVTDGAVCRVVVQNPAQRQAFETDMTRLVEFLRQRTGLPALSVRVEVAEGETQKKLTDEEVLQDVVQRYKELGSFLKDLDMEFM